MNHIEPIFTDTNVLTWVVACGGWLVAVFVAWLGYAERKASQEADLLLKTVAYFEGGTQKRSIGISLIEGILGKSAQHRGVVVPLLVNQFVYLLLHPEVKASVHEERNLVRIYQLLASTPNLSQEHHYSWCEAGDAIYRRLEGECSGLLISEPTLRLWKKGLGHEKSAA
jgi:hypothetical protein